jgi:hypothetical protein
MTADMTELSVAHAAARRVRAEWLAGLEQGFVTLADFLAFAADSTDESSREAVRRMRLVSVLGAALNSRPRAYSAVVHILAVAHNDRDSKLEYPAPSKLRVSWLFDKRTHGKRILMLADALTPRNAPPVLGFPFRVPKAAAA